MKTVDGASALWEWKESATLEPPLALCTEPWMAETCLSFVSNAIAQRGGTWKQGDGTPFRHLLHMQGTYAEALHPGEQPFPFLWPTALNADCVQPAHRKL